MTTRQELAGVAIDCFRDDPALERVLMGVSPRGRRFVLDMNTPQAQIGPCADEGQLISAGWLRAQSQLLLYAERRESGIFVAAGDPWGWLRALIDTEKEPCEVRKQDNFPANQCTLPFRLVSPASMDADELEAVTERWLAIGKSCARWSDTGIPRDGGNRPIEC